MSEQPPGPVGFFAMYKKQTAPPPAMTVESIRKKISGDIIVPARIEGTAAALADRDAKMKAQAEARKAKAKKLEMRAKQRKKKSKR